MTCTDDRARPTEEPRPYVVASDNHHSITVSRTRRTFAGSARRTAAWLGIEPWQLSDLRAILNDRHDYSPVAPPFVGPGGLAVGA